jgi:hypothetical protein
MEFCFHPSKSTYSTTSRIKEAQLCSRPMSLVVSALVVSLVPLLRTLSHNCECRIFNQDCCCVLHRQGKILSIFLSKKHFNRGFSPVLLSARVTTDLLVVHIPRTSDRPTALSLGSLQLALLRCLRVRVSSRLGSCVALSLL